ncbi:MAG: hypothetical protein DI539_02795 [Flavobacterium psychrophilum]|nr:MAG: hypothetical protein DI539_02795 [Flavobacterium psychrophilum]
MTLQEFKDKVSTNFKIIYDDYVENATAFFRSKKEELNDFEFKTLFDEIKYVFNLKSSQLLKAHLLDLESVIFGNDGDDNGYNNFDSGYNHLIASIAQTNYDRKQKEIEILDGKV